MLCSGPPLDSPFTFAQPADHVDGVPAGRLLGEIDLAATPAAVRLARSYVRELVAEYFAVDRFGLGDLELLTSETVTRSVTHAEPRHDGTIMLSVLVIDRLVRVEVTDGGVSPGEWQVPADPLAPLAGGGRGWCLIKALGTGYGAHVNTDGTATFWFGVSIRIPACGS